MSIYDKVINLFNTGPSPTDEKIIELTEKVTDLEEKSMDFSMAMPAVSNGNMYYMNINKFNKAYSTNYVINRCINLLAYNLSKVPLRISRNGEPLPADFKLKGGFDIRQPHPRMSMAKLLYECAVYYWYKGEFMSLIDEDAPFSLEPLDPELMKIKESDGRMILSWRFNNKDIILDEELIYTVMMNPELVTAYKISDYQRTVSLIDVVEKELANYASGREYNLQFFANYAQLGTTLKDVNASATKEDRQAIVDQIDNKLSRGKAYKTRVLPQGMDIADPKNPTMRDMEFSQSLKDIRDIILGIFGVPRSVFGITNEAGLAQSTVDVEERIMWTGTIQPAAHMIQESFNQTLMKRYFPGYQVFFDYSGIKVLQDNMLEKTDLAVKYQGLGYTTEEVNTKLDLGMPESTDTRMIERFHPSSLLPYSEIEFDMNDSTKQITVINNNNDDSINKIVELIDKEETKSVATQRYRSRFNRVQKKTENTMASKLGLYFATQYKKVLSIVKGEKSVKAVNETLLLSEIMNLLNTEKEVLRGIMEPVYTDSSVKGSELALNTLKSDIPPAASESVVKSLTNEIAVINNHTYRLLRTQIKDSINAGETIADMTKRIQQVYRFNKSRARTIARTESLKVISRSTDEEYRKAGVKKKEWLSSPGARDTHARNSAQGAIPYDNAFMNGLHFPGDSGPAAEVVNCRCSLAPVIEE